MKKVITSTIASVCLLLGSCTVDEAATTLDAENQLIEVKSNTSSKLTTFQRSASSDQSCVSTALIAGQNMTAGTVDVTFDGTYLSITYSTTPEWTIGVTHLSIGSCADDPIPTNGGGNPQIGHFEYSDTHPDGTHEVTYIIDASDFDDNYCFAAHAEVSSASSNETAWAEGLDFPGNSWAMYVSSNLSDCPGDDDGSTDDPGDQDTGR